MRENEISKDILDASIRVHRTLGPGLFESVYESALSHELSRRGLRVARQVPVRVAYDGLELGEGFRADLIVEDLVLVELKFVEALAPIHHKQVLTYLSLTGLRLGLLINFNAVLLKNAYVRLAHAL